MESTELEGTRMNITSTITRVWKSDTKIVSFEFTGEARLDEFPDVALAFGGTPLVDLPLDTDLEDYVANQYSRMPDFVAHVRSQLEFQSILIQATEEEVLPASPLTKSLDRIQFEFMVNKLGLTISQIEAAVDSVPSLSEDEKTLAKVLVRSGTKFVRDHPFMQLVPPLAGVTEQQLDEAWSAGTEVSW